MLVLLAVLAHVVMLLFFVYFLGFIVLHHFRVKHKASKLLVVSMLVELFFPVWLIIAFLNGLKILSFLCVGIDFLLVSGIIFDQMYAFFFYDGGVYHKQLSRVLIPFYVAWIFAHCLILSYDVNQNAMLVYSLPGMYAIGVGLMANMNHHKMVIFRELQGHIKNEIDYVEKPEIWKVRVVMLQYVFIRNGFGGSVIGLIFNFGGFLDFTIEGISSFGISMFCLSAASFLIGKGYHLIGFFYPVSMWKEQDQ